MGADRVNRGPLSSTGINPSDEQALVLDKQNNILETSGESSQLAACQTALLILLAQAALANVTAAQNLINLAINGGLLNKQNRTIRIRARGVYTTPGTTTPVLTIALVVGGVTLCSISTAALSATASTNMPFEIDFTFSTVTVGSAGTLEAHGKLIANITANTPAAAASAYLDTNTAVSAAVNLQVAGNLQVQVSANSAITSITLRQASVEVVN